MSEAQSPSRFSLDGFTALARQKLLRDPPPVPEDGLPAFGDHTLSPDLVEFIRAQPVRAASVLVPVVEREEGLHVILTTRTQHLSSHAGQVAFPGGKMDEADDSPAATALREAEEEVGLDRRYVSVLGYGDLYFTGTGFRIVPVVALVSSKARLVANPGEVENIFEVPLAFLFDAANHETHSKTWKGIERSYLAISYGERYIWGATAGMIRNLHDRLMS